MTDRAPTPDAALAVWEARTEHRWSLVNVRGALWAHRAIRRARTDLAASGLRAAVLDPPRHLPPEASRGVRAVLRRTQPTCLERAFVLQRWLALHGSDHDVVVGVAKRDGEVLAHAWMDFERPISDGLEFHELTRHPSRTTCP